MTEILLAFKAGRCFRREGSNFVDADPTKGSITLSRDIEEGLLHFTWRNRSNNDEEDLIIFPSDATFTKVTQSSGRVYVLKFSSSDQRHFFWMQDQSSARDAEFADNLNSLLQDPDQQVTWGSSDSQPQASTSSTMQAPSNTSAPTTNFTSEQLNELSRLILSAAGGLPASEDDELSLTDVLTPANLTPLFTSHPELVPSLFPHLPPDLPVEASADAVRRIINSPQFRAAVANFDQALRTGLLGGMVRQFGLPEEAGTGVSAFLRAVQEQADKEKSEENSNPGTGSSSGSGGDNMETD